MRSPVRRPRRAPRPSSGGPSRRRPRVSFDSAVPAHGSRGTAIYGTPARAPARENGGGAPAARPSGSGEKQRLPSPAVAMKILETIDNLGAGAGATRGADDGLGLGAKRGLLESPFAPRPADGHMLTPMTTLGDTFGAVPLSEKKAAGASLLRNVLSESKKTQLRLTGRGGGADAGADADADAARMPPPPVPKFVLEPKASEKKKKAPAAPVAAGPPEV